MDQVKMYSYIFNNLSLQNHDHFAKVQSYLLEVISVYIYFYIYQRERIWIKIFNSSYYAQILDSTELYESYLRLPNPIQQTIKLKLEDRRDENTQSYANNTTALKQSVYLKRRVSKATNNESVRIGYVSATSFAENNRESISPSSKYRIKLSSNTGINPNLTQPSSSTTLKPKKENQLFFLLFIDFCVIIFCLYFDVKKYKLIKIYINNLY